MDKKVHINFWYVIAAVLGMLWISEFISAEHRTDPDPL